MFEQTFKNIDDILHKDAGCGSELDYVEQTSWILFLKYLDDLGKDRATEAEFLGQDRRRKRNFRRCCEHKQSLYRVSRTSLQESSVMICTNER